MGGQALEIAIGGGSSIAGKVVPAVMVGVPLAAAGIDRFVKSQPGYGAPERPGLSPQAFTAPTTSSAAQQTAYAEAVQQTNDINEAERKAARQRLAQYGAEEEARRQAIVQASYYQGRRAPEAPPPVLG